MKKIVLIIAFIFFGVVNAQGVSKECEFSYKTYSRNSIEDQSRNIYKSVLIWDFSKLGKSVDCKIEIVPIRDCFNHENAVKFKETVILSSKDKNFKLKDTKEFGISSYMTKCFKWRIILVDTKTSCEKITDWRFVSFLNK